MMQWLGGSDPEGAQRATQAMLGMRKIDLAAMQAASKASNPFHDIDAKVDGFGPMNLKSSIVKKA
jgi:hypothetical protein